MSTKVQVQAKSPPSSSFTPAPTGLLQRKCACGGKPGLDGECAECRQKRFTAQPNSTGQAAPTATSASFGHDFGHVRVNEDAPETIQTKLKVNKPGDKFEQEADRVADQVMRMPEVGVQREVNEEEEEELLQTKPLVQRRVAGDDGGNEAPPVVQDVLRSPGRTLDLSTRRFMEPRFSHDFSQVRVHTDAHARESARAVNARAYTVGRDVVFGSGQYVPYSEVGRRLLAHELTHVVQQSGRNAAERRRMPRAVPAAAENPRWISRAGAAVQRSIGFDEVNAENTPAGIKRVPPRQETEVNVSGSLEEGEPNPVLTTERNSLKCGNARIDDQFHRSLAGLPATVGVKGSVQTSPETLPCLKLIAKGGDEKIAESNPFAVAAYPTEIEFNYLRPVIAEFVGDSVLFGSAYNLSFSSDSGVPKDCDRIKISEVLDHQSAKGIFNEEGVGAIQSGFAPLLNSAPDRHAFGYPLDFHGARFIEKIREVGVDESKSVVDQFFRFSCERSGIAEDRESGPKVPKSGFRITKTTSEEDNEYFINVQKEGFENNGVKPGKVDDSEVKKTRIGLTSVNE